MAYNQVALAYGDWFKKFDDLWTYYCTFTCRKRNTKHGSVHPEQLNKIFKLYVHNLNVDIYGKKYRRKKDRGILIARSVEKGGVGGLLHYHALLGNIPSGVNQFELMEEWNKRSGFARIFNYERKKGGAFYIAKSAYAWKRGEVDFIGPWELVDEILEHHRPVFPDFIPESNLARN